MRSKGKSAEDPCALVNIQKVEVFLLSKVFLNASDQEIQGLNLVRIGTDSINNSQDRADIFCHCVCWEGVITLLGSSAVGNHIDEPEGNLLNIAMMDHVRKNLRGLLKAQLTDLFAELFLLKYLPGTLADSIAEAWKYINIVIAEDIE